MAATCFKLSPQARQAALQAVAKECEKFREKNGFLSWETLFKLMSVQKETICLSEDQKQNLLEALEHNPETQESAVAIIELYPQIKKGPDPIS